MMRTETAKRWGGSTTVPLTGFLVLNRKYVIQDAEVNGEKCILIKEDKYVPKLQVKKET
jgi:hypothetical protein